MRLSYQKPFIYPNYLTLKHTQQSFRSSLFSPFKIQIHFKVRCEMCRMRVCHESGGCAIHDYDFLQNKKRLSEIVSSTRDHLNMISLEVGERSRFKS